MIKRFSQFILRQFLNNYPSTGARKIYTTLCFYLRNRIVRSFNDPLIDFDLLGVPLKMNLSYNLPILLKDRPFYNAALPRLSGFLRSRNGHLTFIDIGANIGDTAALISRVVADGKYLCVEASDFYYTALLENQRLIRGITPVKALCDEVEKVSSVSLDVIGDSAVVKDSGGAGIPTTTIDGLVSAHPTFGKANVLKIDTDGYDFKVMRGAKGLIARSHPVIFFEFSPNHLIAAGENPVSICRLLNEAGYDSMLFYDRFGYLFMEIKTTETELVERLAGYSRRKTGEYYDVLTFHRSQQSDFSAFAASEDEFFMKHSGNK
jgi:FkbM family methyltransferase